MNNVKLSPKPPLHKLCFAALAGPAYVFEYGEAKYGAGNWSDADNGGGDHVAAALRHIGAFVDGEARDAESGLHHLDHAISRLIMARGKELKKK